MGWLFSIALFVTAIIKGNELLFIASAIFAVAGSIGLKDFK